MRRLVHVATPNAGTALASKQRLGDLLDVITNLFSLFPEGRGAGALEAALEVVKQAATGALGGLDGLAAMDPDSPELAALNSLATPVSGVHAISTDYEPSPAAPTAVKALDAMVDGVFGAPNDLVVPTDGVFKADNYVVADPFLVTAPTVTHNGFFATAAVRQRLAGWLGLR